MVFGRFPYQFLFRDGLGLTLSLETSHGVISVFQPIGPPSMQG
jgi:hypothetical protein